MLAQLNITKLAILVYFLISAYTPSFGQDAKPETKPTQTAKNPADVKKEGQGQSKDPFDEKSASAMSAAADKLREASSTTVRRFHEVLDELLAEFGYDVKLGQIKGLKNISIRKVDVSDTLPNSYKDYVKLLISERIRENSDVKILNCIPCFGKTSKLIEGKIVITSPQTNLQELKTAADRLGIDNFMDIVLIYHTTHMVLAFQIFKVDTNELVWARTYNSETIKSRFQKLAIDYSQVAQSRPGENYQAEYRILVGVGGAGIPNIGGTESDSTMLDIQVRSTERFDNRRSEFGLVLSTYLSLSSSTTTAAATTEKTATEKFKEADTVSADEPKPFKYALNISGIYSHNFLGAVESYNEVRQALNLGLGALIAAGYIAVCGRVGWDMYFGRRFTLSGGALYIAPSKVLVGTNTFDTTGGFGGEVILSFNF